MKTAFCVFVVLCLINLSIVSSLESPKSCAELAIPPMQGFIKELYVGDWFIHQQYDFPGGDRIRLFSINEDSSSRWTYECHRNSGKTREFRADGLQTYNHPGVGRYMYSSEDIPKYNGEFLIIKTDYVSYTIEYACEDVSGGSIVQLYVMSRNPIVSPITQDNIDEVIIAHQFDRNEIRTLNIVSCPSELKESNAHQFDRNEIRTLNIVSCPSEVKESNGLLAGS